MKQDNRTIVERAIALHTGFLEEMAFFLLFTQTYAEAVLNHHGEYREKWIRENEIYDFDTWMDFVETVYRHLQLHSLAMEKDPHLFAQLLFDGQHRMFTLHCLFSLIQLVPDNEPFNNRIIQLFA